MKHMIIAISVMSFLFTTPALANKYKSNGYETNIYWKVKKEHLRTWGDVSGRNCNFLKGRITFKNSKTYSTETFYIDIGRVSKAGRTTFRGDPERLYKPRKKNWYVKEIHFYCN